MLRREKDRQMDRSMIDGCWEEEVAGGVGSARNKCEGGESMGR
jgi:hypothetical protein